MPSLFKSNFILRTKSQLLLKIKLTSAVTLGISFLIVATSLLAGSLTSHYLTTISSQTRIYDNPLSSNFETSEVLPLKLEERLALESDISNSIIQEEAIISNNSLIANDMGVQATTGCDDSESNTSGYCLLGNLAQKYLDFSFIPPLNASLGLLSNTHCSLSTNSLTCNIFRLSFILPISISAIFLLWRLIRTIFGEGHLIVEASKSLILSLLIMSIPLVSFLASFWISLSRIEARSNESLQTQLKLMTEQQPLTDGNYPVYQVDSIARIIETTDEIPTIISSNSSTDFVMRLLLAEKTLSFTQKYFLINQILSYNLRNASLPHLALTQNNQLISRLVQKRDLSVLLPLLSEKIIKTEFERYGPNFITYSPNDVQILSAQEYQRFQELKQEEQKQQVATFIGIIQSEIAEINQLTSFNTNLVEEINSELNVLNNDRQEYVTELEEDYNQYCAHTELKETEECKNLLETMNTNKQLIAEYEESLRQSKAQAEEANSEATAYLNQYQIQLSELNQLLTLLQNTPVNTETQSGVFLSDGKILIKFDDGSLVTQEEETESSNEALVSSVFEAYIKPKTFTEYLSTSIHEHLHYVSFDNTETLWPVFMEEGLTELMAIEALSPYVGEIDDLGLLAYGSQVDLLLKSFETLDKSRVIQLYFEDKTRTSLEELFNNTYDDFDYDDFRLKGESLLYVGYENLEEREELREELEEMLGIETEE